MSKYTYINVAKVNAEMDQMREDHGISTAQELAEVKGTLSVAKRNGQIGDKMMASVNPLLIHFPSWQRSVHKERAIEIAANYQPALWELPKVFIVNGKMFCFDGMHRCYAAAIANMESIVVEILSISEIEAAVLFMNQSKVRRKVDPADVMGAGIASCNPDYLKLARVCKANHINVKKNPIVSDPVGVLNDVNKCLSYSEEQLTRVLVTIKELEWNGNGNTVNPFGSKVTRSIERLYANNKGREDRVKAILIANCKGSVWFEENCGGKTQTKIFDILTEIVDRKIAKDNKILKIS